MATIRQLTKEEVAQLNIDELLPHEFISETWQMSKYDTIANDIKINGIKEAILLYQGDIIDGLKRQIIAIDLNIATKDIPFAEFVGTDEEALEYITRKKIRGTDSDTTIVIYAKETLIPQLKAYPGGWRKHPSFEDGMKEVPELAAKILDSSATYIKRGDEIERHCEELYNHMKASTLDLLDAYKLIRPERWTKKISQIKTNKKLQEHIEWLRKMINIVRDQKIQKDLQYELEIFEKLPPISEKDEEVVLEDYDYARGIVIPVYKKSDEENEDFNKKIASMQKDFNKLCAQYGYPEIHFVRGKNGIDLVYAAVNEARRLKEKAVRTFVVTKEEAKLISKEELENYSITQEKPDTDIEKEYQQYIGGKTKMDIGGC